MSIWDPSTWVLFTPASKRFVARARRTPKAPIYSDSSARLSCRQAPIASVYPAEIPPLSRRQSTSGPESPTSVTVPPTSPGLVYRAFSTNSFANEKGGPEVGEARRLQYLLCDLVRAAESRTSLAIVARLPNLDSAAKVLPVDLILPARVLVRALLTEVSAVPVPTAHVEKRDVAVLAELLQSDVYGTYRMAHQALEQVDVGLREGLARVSSSALAVRHAGGRHINIIDRVISFLPATTKLIEELAGKPAGIVAEALAKPFETWLRSRSRIVIYRFDVILDELMQAWEKTDKTAEGT
jgi:hypothetical protein